jgi:hypothetical protein
MSIRSSARSLVIVTLSLGVTSLAFARTPPALVASQTASGHVASNGGYRDALTRASEDRGTEAGRASAGYRDSLTRFAGKSTRVRVASR